MVNILYTKDDIDRIFKERCSGNFRESIIKKGVIFEWAFKYPNENITGEVEYAFCLDEQNYDFEKGCNICLDKAKDKLWRICGQYSLATGNKL